MNTRDLPGIESIRAGDLHAYLRNVGWTMEKSVGPVTIFSREVDVPRDPDDPDLPAVVGDSTLSDYRERMSAVVDLLAATETRPTIQVLKPTIGQIWKFGKKKQIKFIAPPGTVGDVRFELSRDGGMTFQTIIASVPVTKGKKKWVVVGPATNAAIIRIVLNQNPDVYGVMPAPFIIQP